MGEDSKDVVENINKLNDKCKDNNRDLKKKWKFKMA